MDDVRASTHKENIKAALGLITRYKPSPWPIGSVILKHDDICALTHRMKCVIQFELLLEYLKCFTTEITIYKTGWFKLRYITLLDITHQKTGYIIRVVSLVLSTFFFWMIQCAIFSSHALSRTLLSIELMHTFTWELNNLLYCN